MYAVIRSGGKQYRVAPGETVKVETLAGKVGGEVAFGEVLAVSTDDKKVLAGKDAAAAKVDGQDRRAGTPSQAHRVEVQDRRAVQDPARPPAELHRRAGQRHLTLRAAPRGVRRGIGHGT